MAAFLGFIVQSLPVVSGEHWFAPYRGYVAGVSPQEQWDNVPAIGKLQILVAIGMLESYGEGAGNPEGYVHYCNGLCSGVLFLHVRRRAVAATSSPPRRALRLTSSFSRRRPPRLLPADRRPRRLRPGWLQPLRPLQLVRLSAYPGKDKVLGVCANTLHRRGVAAQMREPSPHRVVSSQARGRQVEINNGRAAMLGIFMMLSESAVPGAVPRSRSSTTSWMPPASRSSTGRPSTSRSSARSAAGRSSTRSRSTRRRTTSPSSRRCPGCPDAGQRAQSGSDHLGKATAPVGGA